jgi:hypothetical protein
MRSGVHDCDKERFSLGIGALLGIHGWSLQDGRVILTTAHIWTV